MATKRSSQQTIKATRADPVESHTVRLSDQPSGTKDEQERATEETALPVKIPIGAIKPITSKGKQTSVGDHSNDNDREERRPERRNDE